MFVLTVLEVLLPPLLLCGLIGYGALRLVRALEDVFGIGSAPDRELVESLEEARRLVGRIRERLKAEDGEEVVAQELEELVENRLPAALERQRELLSHLAGRSEAALLAEERDFRRKLQAAADPELKRLLQRNLDLVSGRIQTRARLELASRKADAQIRAVLINLGGFEDRLIASRLDTVRPAALPFDELVEDVALLEAAYDELKLGDGSSETRKDEKN